MREIFGTLGAYHKAAMGTVTPDRDQTFQNGCTQSATPEQAQADSRSAQVELVLTGTIRKPGSVHVCQ